MLNKSQIKKLMQELMPNTELDADGLPSSQTIAKPTEYIDGGISSEGETCDGYEKLSFFEELKAEI